MIAECRRFTLVFCLLCTAMAPSAFAKAAPTTTSSLSGRDAASSLRAMPQRLSKLYVQANLNIEGVTARDNIARGIQTIDALIAQLESAKLSGGSARSLNRISSHWENMRQSLEQPADLARIKSISADAESISLAAQKLSLQLESANEPQLTRLYDLALRNDMLAQRLARIYLDINAGHNGGSQQVDLRQTQREFATSLKELQIAPEGNDRIRRKLQLAQQQWLFFDSAVSSNLKQDGQAMRNVTTTSERISEVMVDIAKNYKDLISPPVLAQK